MIEANNEKLEVLICCKKEERIQIETLSMRILGLQITKYK